MAEQRTVCIEWVEGIKVSRRGLAWLLSSPVETKWNAKTEFLSLNENIQRQFKARFGAWVDGFVNDKWFHGWSETGYRDCFVFKYQERRIYGFLCNPRPQEKSFQLCVLVSYTTKHEHTADPKEKNKVAVLRNEFTVLRATSSPEDVCFQEEL